MIVIEKMKSKRKTEKTFRTLLICLDRVERWLLLVFWQSIAWIRLKIVISILKKHSISYRKYSTIFFVQFTAAEAEDVEDRRH